MRVEGLLEDGPMPWPAGPALEGHDHPPVAGHGTLQAAVLEGHPHGLHARRHLSVLHPHASEALALGEAGVAVAEGYRSSAAGYPVVGDRPARQLRADDVRVSELGFDTAALRPVFAACRPEQHQSVGRTQAADVAWGSDEGRAGPYAHHLTDVLAQPRVGRRSERARDRRCRWRDGRCHDHCDEQPEKRARTHVNALTIPLTTRKTPAIPSAPAASLEALARSQMLKRRVACSVHEGATRYPASGTSMSANMIT